MTAYHAKLQALTQAVICLFGHVADVSAALEPRSRTVMPILVIAEHVRAFNWFKTHIHENCGPLAIAKHVQAFDWTKTHLHKVAEQSKSKRQRMISSR